MPEPAGTTLDEACARSDRVVARRVSGELVLVPLAGHGEALQAIYSLNAVGAFVWERLDGRAPGREVVAALVAEFEVPLERAEADYLGFVETLRGIGAVAPAGTGHGRTPGTRCRSRAARTASTAVPSGRKRRA